MKFEIRAHFDALRGIHYISGLETLATISEDCSIKLWDFKNIQKKNLDLEQLTTLRGHIGPIYAVTGSAKAERGLERIIYTAGEEGTIKVWNVPDLPKDDKYPELKGRNFMVAEFDDGVQEPYWHLHTNPFLDVLLAVKSDQIQIWDTKSLMEKARTYKQSDVQQCKADFIKATQPMKTYQASAAEGPSCASWLPTDNTQFVVGYFSSHLVFFNH